MKIEEKALEYFKYFKQGNICELSEMYHENIRLIDWNGEWSSKKEVLEMNESLFNDNKISVYVIIGIITFIGINSYDSMPKESFPEVKQPIIYINTAYPGNSPLDMENLVCRPIEKEINTISGLKKLNSTNIQDFSIIVAEFELSVKGEKALLEVKDAIDRAKIDLPNAKTLQMCHQ